ncbi:MAG TPA: hypothetical protein VHX43_15525 [Xanthobacteraceae bacterium]|nr:hypothetical protein [Xanthobacteraceae bacterium]
MRAAAQAHPQFHIGSCDAMRSGIAVPAEERRQCFYAHGDGAGESGEQTKEEQNFEQNFENVHGIAR